MEKIKIAIADDHSLFASTLAGLLNSVENMEVVIVASDGKELLEEVEKTGLPDVIILDVEMPVMDGFKTASRLVSRYPSARIIALSMHKERSFIAKMINNGVSGYLLKNAKPEEVIEAINSVYDGGLPFNKEAVSVMKSTCRKSVEQLPLEESFTRREIEIIKYISYEYTNQEIADKLLISKSTVETHKKNIITKLNVRNSIGIALYAVSRGLVDV